MTEQIKLRSDVREFAEAMELKLRKHDRTKGRRGWRNDCSFEYLKKCLNEHIKKGDMVDVGNLAMMLWDWERCNGR